MSCSRSSDSPTPHLITHRGVVEASHEHRPHESGLRVLQTRYHHIHALRCPRICIRGESALSLCFSYGSLDMDFPFYFFTHGTSPLGCDMCICMVASPLIRAIFYSLYCYILYLIRHRCPHTSRIQSDIATGEYDWTLRLYASGICGGDEGDVGGEIVSKKFAIHRKSYILLMSAKAEIIKKCGR